MALPGDPLGVPGNIGVGAGGQIDSGVVTIATSSATSTGGPFLSNAAPIAVARMFFG